MLLLVKEEGSICSPEFGKERGEEKGEEVEGSARCGGDGGTDDGVGVYLTREQLIFCEQSFGA
jgi:hypothetical protein